MPGHMGLIPKTSGDAWARGRHPDLWGGMEMPDVQMTPNVEDRDRNRAMSDPGRRAHFMQQVAMAQSLEPASVQSYLNGTPYAGTFAEGMRRYVADRDEARRWEAEANGQTTYVDDKMVADNDLDWYDRHFDAHGKPLPGVYYHANRSMLLDDRTDSYSRREGGGR